MRICEVVRESEGVEERGSEGVRERSCEGARGVIISCYEALFSGLFFIIINWWNILSLEGAKLRGYDDLLLKCPFFGVICYIYYHCQYVIIFIIKSMVIFFIQIITS
jgi:hypothetical protein